MAETRRKFHPNDLMPNSTQVPNVLLDRVMPVATPATFKVLMCVARQTYGWRKEWDAISITQLEEKTGLSDRRIIDTMEDLRQAGLVLRRNGEEAQYGMEYSLNMECDFDQAVAFLQQQTRERAKRERPSGGRKTGKNNGEPSSPEVVNPVQSGEPSSGCNQFTGDGEPSSPDVVNPVQTQKLTNQNPLSKLTGEASDSSNGNGNGHRANANTGLAARLEAIRQSRAEQKPLYRAERLLLPTETDEGLNATEVAWAVCGELGRRGDADRIAMEGAVVAYRVKFQDKSWEQCAEDLMKAWSEYEEITRTLQLKPPECFGFRGFLDSSQYLKRESWPKGNSPGAGEPIGPSVAEQQRERRRAATVDRQRSGA